MTYKKHPTRYNQLFYGMEYPGRWTFFHFEPSFITSTGEEVQDRYSPMGERYPTRAELMADLHRYAEWAGYESKG